MLSIISGVLLCTLTVFHPLPDSYRCWRCLIEGVIIAKQVRGQGLGEKMFEHAIERARERSCNLVQLTSDKQRPDALRFYEKLGFVASHEGFKLTL